MGRASHLGFPTINIPLEDKDVSGIFAATVTTNSATYHAAAYADQKRHVLEAHLLDFSGDITGEVTIELVEKIRGDEVFTDDETLKTTMAADVRAVRDYFSFLQNSRIEH